MLLAVGVTSAGRAGVTSAQSDAAFEAFWAASTRDGARLAADAIAAGGASFDEVFSRLQAGRAYAKDVPTGVIRGTRRADGQDFFYSLQVPDGYDPGRRYPARFELHGGIGAREDNRPRLDQGVGALAGDEPQIYVLPASWIDSPWWSEAQVRNLAALLDVVKRTYNIDENRVALSGVSDGGTAAFYVGMRDPTPYASFLPLIGSLMTLAGRTLALGDLFPNNLLNRPFFIVNGGRDLLYPTIQMDPVVRYLRSAGVSVVYLPQPDAGHDTTWWPEVKPSFEQFVREHPRNPLPDRLTWQRGEDDPFDRAHWLIVDRLGESGGPVLPDVNVIPTPPALQFGARISGHRVTYVEPRSNAASLGLRSGDVVIGINEQALPQDTDLDWALTECCRPGAAVRLLVSRQGATVELKGIYEPGNTFGPTVPLFPRRKASGRVDLVKTGNAVRVSTNGVTAYTLLLSPDAFDFTRPVTVTTNGIISFRGRVEKSLTTLLKWAAIDNDRAMLFGAELHLTVN